MQRHRLSSLTRRQVLPIIVYHPASAIGVAWVIHKSLFCRVLHQDVNPIANQYYCEGATAPLTALTGTVPGTTYNWTNTNTAIGLAASGTGDIPSFTATNGTPDQFQVQSL